MPTNRTRHHPYPPGFFVLCAVSLKDFVLDGDLFHALSAKCVAAKEGAWHVMTVVVVGVTHAALELWKFVKIVKKITVLAIPGSWSGY